MKIRSLLPIFVLTAQMAAAATFNLPKDAPLFSIEMPDKWLTEEKRSVLIARPVKDSKVNISVSWIMGAKSLEDAFTKIEKAVRANYQEFNAGKPSQEKEAGMDFLSAAGKGKRNGVDFRIAWAAFSPDGQRYYTISWECDEASGKTYGDDIDRTMDSIKSFKEEARKTKETHDKAISLVPFPKDKPAFTIEVPNGYATDATTERLIIKTKEERKPFLYVGAVPAGDGIVDPGTAKAWLPKKGQALLDALGDHDAAAARGVEEYMPNLAGHKAFEIEYSGLSIALTLWIFTPDEKRYFYAYFQRQDDLDDAPSDDEPLGWQTGLVGSIKAAK